MSEENKSMNEWQPIKSAPMEDMVLFVDGEGVMYVGSAEIEKTRVMFYVPGEDDYGYYIYPIAWMPLPKAPKDLV